jgi:uncharacterized damage-inducible protein DinB
LKISELFFQRYDVLYSFWLAGIWEVVPPEQMRERPHPNVNSIAWNLWHLARVEDAGVNRFVTDGVQVLGEGGWAERMNIPWRHHGSGMSFAEVDQLNQAIDLAALQAYCQAVQERTCRVVSGLDDKDLDAVMTAGRLREILSGDGLAHSGPEGFLQNYLGWTKGKCLFNFALTHPYQHVGEIGVIASLLGITFE